MKPRNWIPQRKWSSHSQGISKPQAMNSKFQEHSRKLRPFPDRREIGEATAAIKLTTLTFQESTGIILFKSGEHFQN